MKNLKYSVLFKVGVIIILILLLLIPTSMVQSLIREREWTQESAISEVSEKWGNGQTITGPYISIPYDKYVKQYSEKDSAEVVVKFRDWIYFLPDDLQITGDITPSKRKRHIFEVVVYESGMAIEGSFDAIDITTVDVNPNHVHFDKASLNIGISDLKGIEEQIELDWNGQAISFNSGTSTNDLVSSGIQLPIDLSNYDSTSYKFDLSLSLKGSQHLYFNPLGKTTDVQLSSNWTTPSFTGNFLPDDHQIDESGFTANWNVLHLNRNYPQSWKSGEFQIGGSSFGTDLLLPVDRYTKSHRVARYAILFIVFTFIVFFFVEVLNKVFIHPIQYLLVGIALVVFYTLLLSMSEYISFNWAYIIAMILTLGLIFGYTIAVLKSKKLAAMVSSILFVLYAFIFTIIQLEHYALLLGSFGIFTVLAIVMYFSRKIDWYAIKMGQGDMRPEASEEE